MTINATTFRKNIFDILSKAVKYNEVINVSTKDGNAVVLSEADYADMVETLYLLSVPGMRERLMKAKDTPYEECDEFAW